MSAQASENSVRKLGLFTTAPLIVAALAAALTLASGGTLSCPQMNPNSGKAIPSEEQSSASPRQAVSRTRDDATLRTTGSIRGRVFDETGRGIGSVSVSIGSPGSMSRTSVMTSEDGSFEFKDLAAVSYALVTSVPGYVRAEEPLEREYYRLGDVVNLRMVKGGVITGIVTNARGEPVTGIRISAQRIRDQQGRTITNPYSTSRLSDDRGVYRIYTLLPGSYLVYTTWAGVPFSYASDAPTYYPSGTRDEATPVSVAVGQETTGIDIRHRGEPGHVISGRLSIEIATSRTRPIANVWATRPDSGAIESGSFTQLDAGPDGNGFALHGLRDGDYDVTAYYNAAGATSAASIPRRVTIKGADVTGLELALKNLGGIEGSVSLETPGKASADECPANDASLLSEIVLKLHPDRDAHPLTRIALGPADASVGSNGVFKFNGVTSASYRIQAHLPSENWYVDSIKQVRTAPSTQIDLAQRGLSVAWGEQVKGVVLTLKQGAASLAGSVEGYRPESSSAIRVHLIPADPDSADNVLRFAEAGIDGDGRFSFRQIAPGKYRILVQLSSDRDLRERDARPLAWDPAAREKLRQQAQSASLLVELKRCQHLKDQIVSRPSHTRKKDPH